MAVLATLIPSFAVTILAVTAAKLLYETFLSPLCHIPGPLLAKLSEYYIILIDTTGNRTSHIHNLHRKYGSIVRIGPNEVSFSSPTAAKEIYNHGTPFLKAPWYEFFGRPPFGIFQLLDQKQHAARRKLLAPAFSQRAVSNVEPTIHELARKLTVIIMSKSSQGQSVNVLDYFRRISVDIVGELFLGQSFSALEAEGKPNFLKWMDEQSMAFGIEYAFPPVIKLLGILPFGSIVDFLNSADKVCEFAEERFEQYLKQHGRKSTRRDLLTRFLTSNEEAEKSGEPVLSDVRIVREVGNMIFAGTDTTSATLTYLFWELAKHQEWQDKLRKEVTKATLASDGPLKFSDLADLSILNAVVYESLRMHPAAPASLPRSTPQGGRILDGCAVPENTVVSVQAYTTHRDPEAFPEPDVWDPTRWLAGDGKGALSQRAKDLFLPFSRGPRVCIGIGIALTELKVITALLVKQMKWRPAPTTTEDTMEMKTFFLATTKSGRCDLIFESVA